MNIEFYEEKLRQVLKKFAQFLDTEDTLFSRTPGEEG
jgi:hypothetical protein